MTYDELLYSIAKLESRVKSGSNYELVQVEAQELLQIVSFEEDNAECSTEFRCRILLIIAQTLLQRGMAKEALPYAQEALEHAERRQLKDLIAKSLANIGSACFLFWDYAATLEYYSRALALSIELGNKQDIALFSGSIGIVYCHLADYPKALEYIGNALTLAEELGNKQSVATWVGNIGNVYQYIADFPKALEYYGRALALNEELGNKQGMASIFGHMGHVRLKLSEYSQALEQYRCALALYEELGNKLDVANIIRQIGLLHRNLSDYTTALKHMSRANALYEELGYKHGMAIIAGDTGSLYFNMSAYPKALEYYSRALALNEEADDKKGIAILTGNIGNVYMELADYPQALEYLSRALALSEKLALNQDVAIISSNIGNLYINLADYPQALEYLRNARMLFEKLGIKSGMATTTGYIGNVYAKEDFDGYDPAIAEEHLRKALAMFQEIGGKKEQYEFHLALSKLCKQQKRWEECLYHFARYDEIKEEVQSEEAKKQAEKLDYERKEAEREKLLAVERARHDATQQLLHNTLPPQIADRLLLGERIADFHANVSVLFADIVDFTGLSQTLSAKELVEGLDFLFSQFDDLAEKYGLEKIKTIGDCYMVIAGAPVARADHAEAIVRMALEMMEVAAGFRAIATGEPMRLRIGLHSGEVVAGVIGRRKYTYDLWGDAVNTASRMESHGEAGRIHCSEDFISQIGVNYPEFRFTPRGEIDIKGKGIMRTFFVERNQ